MPSLVVIEQPCMLQSNVRQELAVKSSILSSIGSYLEIKTTQAPQPPVKNNHFKIRSSKLKKKKSWQTPYPPSSSLKTPSEKITLLTKLKNNWNQNKVLYPYASIYEA
ncbi:hypothetical protein S83_025896 [Arachis hypogaea]